MIDISIDTDEYENENIPEENQEFYKEWYDSGSGQSQMSEWCTQLLNISDGNTFENFVFTGDRIYEAASEAIERFRLFKIISKIKAVSLSFYCRNDVDLSRYSEIQEELRNWAENDTTIFYNLVENSDQKEEVTAKFVVNYKLIKASKDTKISNMNFSVRSFNRLKNLNVTTLGDLTALTSLEDPNVRYCSCGHKSEKEIMWVLEKLGLRLGMKDEDWK